VTPPAIPPDPSRYAVRQYRTPPLRLTPAADAPDQLDLAAARRWVRSQPKPTAVDIFCGAGGLSLGLRDAGFSVLVGADNDPWSVETHRANLGGLGYVGDLAESDDFLDHLDAWGIRRVDLVAGGVPCQPFSRAGRSKIRSLVDAGMRSTHDPRSQMWRSFIRVVEHLNPRAVLLENVPDLATWDEGAVIVSLCESLRLMGYSPHPAIINAYEHRVPQHRSRLFVVALRDGVPFSWPEPSKVQVSVRDAIGDLPKAPPAQREDALEYQGPMTAFQRRMRRGVKGRLRTTVHDHLTRDVRVDDAEAFALLSEGQTYKDLPARLQRYRTDIFTDKYKRLEWDGLSRSITAHIAKDGYWYIHPEQHRTLSIREAARIQTFPDWFRFAGQPSPMLRQIGNAVPPLLAEAIGLSIQAGLRCRVTRPSSNRNRRFRDDLLSWHATHSRSFPWRDVDDPWHVLMAEVCLHRTRADQVVPAFQELCRIAPTPAAMVADRVGGRRAMKSLGLKWRAENMIAIADVLVRNFGGKVPDTEVGLMSLPGVGDYIAQAVLTFAFQRRAVLMDTNTERIVGRVQGHEASRRWQIRLDLHQMAGIEGADSRFNYALLDLGALVCKATSPKCLDCPVRRHCQMGGQYESSRPSASL
jgi:DNA (cytosine-5)-methyltransferase 1